jgi:hypothetical protein
MENDDSNTNIRHVDEGGDDNSPDVVITATEDYELVIDGFRCPDEYLAEFTPLDFEEVCHPIFRLLFQI